MKKTILTSVVMTTCAVSAFAAELGGAIEIGGRYGDVKGNQAKFNEYRDLRSAVTLGFDLGILLKDYHLELTGKNSGFVAEKGAEARELKDQSYLLQGGKYEYFKYSLFYDEIPHNITYGARTLYPGAGTSNPGTAAVANNATVAAMNTATKYSVDYALTRRNYGATAELSMKSPFFVSARVDRGETNGTLPVGTYSGNIKEIPMPINFLTDNLYLETGYRTRNLVATLDGTISSFHQQNPTLNLAFTNAAQQITLPPGNEYFKIGGSVKYDIPAITSTLMARGSHSRLTSEINLSDPLAVVGNNTHFSGDISYTTASAALTSKPVQNLDTRLFVNYLNKKNESNSGFRYGTTNVATADTEGFGYHKINGGFDVGYKLPAKTKLSAGYEYLNLVRAIRDDAAQTVDHIAYVQVKNDLLEWMSGKLRYQYLNRESDFRTLTDPANLSAGYFRPADAASKTRNAIKAGLDIEPLHNLALGFEYAFKQDDYGDSILGIQNEIRHDFHIDANLTVGIFKFNPYYDLEIADQNSRHREASTTENYFWNNSAQNIYYAVGFNSEIQIIKDRLTANIGARYEDSSGVERFSSDTIIIQTLPMVDNNSVDNYIKKSVTGKLTAKLTKELTATLGYTFEKLQYADDHYTGYTNYPLTSYALTGAYNNPDYTAHVGFLTVAYTF